MQDKQARTKKFRLFLFKYRILLYGITLLLGILSLIGLRTNSVPEWIRLPGYAAAFCGLCLSLYILISRIMAGIRQFFTFAAEESPVLGSLCASARRRAFLFAVPGFILNVLFAGSNAAVGLKSWSAWYLSLATYYLLLCLMRASLLLHEFSGLREGAAKRASLKEWSLYSRCGILLMLMSAALIGVVILMVKKGYSRTYPGYWIYMVALYTFVKGISSLVHILKARKQKTPLVSDLRNIGYADAMVSMLSLQTAMFAAFGQGSQELAAVMNPLTGSAVCLIVMFLGLFMVLSARRQTGKARKSHETSGMFML